MVTRSITAKDLLLPPVAQPVTPSACQIPGAASISEDERQSGKSPSVLPSLSAHAWFDREYPRLNALHRGEQARGSPDGIGMIEFTQEAGEVVVVPGDWWHVVLLLEPSVTFTENWVATVLSQLLSALALSSTRRTRTF